MTRAAARSSDAGSRFDHAVASPGRRTMNTDLLPWSLATVAIELLYGSGQLNKEINAGLSDPSGAGGIEENSQAPRTRPRTILISREKSSSA
jgi:hypothetical protein